MSKPILTSDLIKDDGAIKRTIIDLQLLSKEYEALKANVATQAAQINVSFNQTNTATATQRKEIKNTAIEVDKLDKEYKKYNSLLGENAVKLAALKDAQRQQNALNKNEAKLLASKQGSYNALSAQYSINKIRLNQMTVAERENTAEGRKLVTTTNDIFQEMKRLQEVTGKHTLSVGDYGKAMRETQGPLGSFSRGVQGAGTSLKALLANPVVLFLSLIAGAASALFGAFAKSEKGANLMAKASGLLNGVLSGLVDIAVSIADAIEFAFNNPKEALKQFGKLLFDQVVNRIKAAVELVGAFGKILYNAVTLNLDGVKDAAGEANTAMIKLATGLDSEDQKKFADAISNVTKEIVKETNAFIALEQAKRAVRKSNRELVKSIEGLTTAEQTYQAIADDTTKSFKEREDAAEKARQSIEARAAKEIELAKNNLSLLNTEIDLRRSNGEEIEDLLDRQLDAYREVKGAERELTLARLDNEKTLNELQQDRLERDLDILIDGFDNQKTINEKRISDDKLTFEQRAAILSDTAKLADDSFAKQIETIQKFTGAQVDANDLINESDAVALNQKIRSLGLSEIIEGRLLEIVRERRIAVQDLNEVEVELNDKKAEAAAKQAKADETAAIKKAELEKKALEDKRDAEQEAFDQQQAFAQSEFDLLKSTALDKERFTLNAEKERLQKMLELNEKFGGDLTALQIATIKNGIKAVQEELDGLGKEEKKVENIFDLIGVKLKPEQEKAIVDGYDFIKGQLLELQDFKIQTAQRNIEAADNEVEAAENALNREIEARNANQANNVETAQRDLAAAKANQAKAIEQERKAQRDKQRITDAETLANLILATAKNFANSGGIGGIVTNAIMLAAFAATKIRAAKLSKTRLSKGRMTIVGGGSHASGNDTPLGFDLDGAPAYAEQGEAHMILSKQATRRNKPILKTLFSALNNGTLADNFEYQNTRTEIPSFNYSSSTDMSRTEDTLSQINRAVSNKQYIDERGNLVVINGNMKTTYVK